MRRNTRGNYGSGWSEHSRFEQTYSHLLASFDSRSLRTLGKERDAHISKPTQQSRERRIGLRYRMKASTFFRWKGSGNNQFQGEGVIRDISLRGIYVWTATCPPVDSKIQMDVIIPPLFDVSKRQIKAEMRVLRVEHDFVSEGRSGFSAVTKSFKLCAPLDRTSNRIAIFGRSGDGDELIETAGAAVGGAPHPLDFG
jgi:hypothetical protein